MFVAKDRLSTPPKQGRPSTGSSTAEKRVCKRHGLVDFHRYSLGRDGFRYRCKRCVGEAVTRRHRRIREILVAENGGCCAVCGYDRCHFNLQFHHVDPSQKAMGMAMGVGRSLAAFRAEAKKCVLVCANCHGEIECGLLDSPPPGATFARAPGDL
jgi:hypothetical protein